MNFGKLAIEYKQLVKLIMAGTRNAIDTPSFVVILTRVKTKSLLQRRKCRLRRESKFYQLLYPSISMQ